jgi:glycosyltransferase 2 family protein
MNKRLGTILKYFLFFSIGVFLVWWQFHRMTPEQFVKFKYALSTANYQLIIPVIIMALASHISRSMRWRILIRPLGYNPSLFNVFGSIMAGYLANSFVTRIGEILRCTLLGRYEKIPTEKLLGTIVFERIFDLICYLIFIVFTILIQFKLVGSYVVSKMDESIKHSNGILLLIKMILLTGGAIIAFLLARLLFRKNKGTAIIIRITSFIDGLKEGISAVKKLKKRRFFLAHTFFIWSMYLLQVYIGFGAIKEISHLGLEAACSVLTLATIAMIVMPGGLGAFPKAVAWVLILYSVDEAVGEAFGFLMWGITTFIVLFFGLLFTGLMYFINKRKQHALINTISAE